MKLTAQQQTIIIAAFGLNARAVTNAIAESSDQLKTIDADDSHWWSFVLGHLTTSDQDGMSDAAHEAFSRLNKIVNV